MFDGWNPAFAPVPQIAETVAEMNSWRTPEQSPLEVYYRLFAQAPHHSESRPDSVDKMAESATQAAEAGFTEVIVDTNFWDVIDSPKAWADVPAKMVPVLEAVR